MSTGCSVMTLTGEKYRRKNIHQRKTMCCGSNVLKLERAVNSSYDGNKLLVDFGLLYSTRIGDYAMLLLRCK